MITYWIIVKVLNSIWINSLKLVNPTSKNNLLLNLLKFSRIFTMNRDFINPSTHKYKITSLPINLSYSALNRFLNRIKNSPVEFREPFLPVSEYRFNYNHRFRAVAYRVFKRRAAYKWVSTGWPHWQEKLGKINISSSSKWQSNLGIF